MSTHCAYTLFAVLISCSCVILPSSAYSTCFHQRKGSQLPWMRWASATTHKLLYTIDPESTAHPGHGGRSASLVIKSALDGSSKEETRTEASKSIFYLGLISSYQRPCHYVNCFLSPPVGSLLWKVAYQHGVP